MRSLFHYPHDSISRQVRLILAEKNLDYRDEPSHPLDCLDKIANHNPAMTLPILLDEPPTGGQIAISPITSIIEYLEEAYPMPALMPATSANRAEVRRLISWFNEKFHNEVNPYLADEFIDKRLRRKGQPNPDHLRTGRDHLAWHMDYLNWLCEHRDWLAGERLTMADLVCAAHISLLDYCDLVPWKDFSHCKDWYARIKSRPSFRPLLQERIQGLPAARHYDNPDF